MIAHNSIPLNFLWSSPFDNTSPILSTFYSSTPTNGDQNNDETKPFQQRNQDKKSFLILSHLFLKILLRSECLIQFLILMINVLLIFLMMLKFLLLSRPEYMPGLIYSTWYSNMRRSAKSLDFHEVWSGVIFWQYPGISDFAALRILRNFPRLENL